MQAKTLSLTYPGLAAIVLAGILAGCNIGGGSSDAGAAGISQAEFDTLKHELKTQILDGHSAIAQKLGYHPQSYSGTEGPSRTAAAVVSDCETAGTKVSDFANSGGMSPAGWVLMTCHGWKYPLDSSGNVTGLLATAGGGGSPIVGFSGANCTGTQYLTQGPGLLPSDLAGGVVFRLGSGSDSWRKAGGPGTSTQQVDFASSMGFDTHGNPLPCSNAMLTGLDAYVVDNNDSSTGVTSGQIDPITGSP